MIWTPQTTVVSEPFTVGLSKRWDICHQETKLGAYVSACGMGSIHALEPSILRSTSREPHMVNNGWAAETLYKSKKKLERDVEWDAIKRSVPVS